MLQSHKVSKKILTTIISTIRNNILLICILISTTFFRFYDALNRYSLGYESIRDANVAIVGATSLQLPLTGPFSSLGPFTFGPWYWYQLIFFHAIFPFAYSSWVLLGITSILYILILFKIGEMLGNKYLGAILALLATISPYMIAWSTLLTNPGFTHVFSALSIWIFLKIIKNNMSYWWGFALGITIGIGVNIHYQIIPYLLFLLAIPIFNVRKYVHTVTASVGFIITFIPLLFFDLINNWYMVRTAYHAYSTMKDRIYVPNSWKIYLFDFWPSTWSETIGIPSQFGILIIVFVSITMGYLVLSKRISKELFFITSIFVLMFIHLRFYGGERFMGYIHYLQIFIFLYTGYSIWWLKNLRYGKYAAIIVISCLTMAILPRSFDQLEGSTSTRDLKIITTEISQLHPNEPVRLYHCDEGQDPGDIMSIMFLLYKEDQLHKEGKKIGISESTCYTNIPSNIRSNLKVTKTDQAISFADLDSIHHDELIEYGWSVYSMEKRYKESALWWFESKIN